MTEPVLLEAALADLAAILPGTALADTTSGGGLIRPDPDAKPRPPQDPVRTPRDPRPVAWTPDAISVLVRTYDQAIEGYRLGDGRSKRMSPAVISLAKDAPLRIEAFYYVDAQDMPRPLPFAPPQVGFQWYFTPDGGAPGKTSVLWDPAPVYRGENTALMPSFGYLVVNAVLPGSGWLTLSGRIDDPERAVEFDDTVRVIVAA